MPGSVTSNSSSHTSSASSGFSREQIIILISIFIGQFFCNACLALPAPFLPHRDEMHHIGGDFTGWIIGLSPLLQLLFCPIFGKLLPHIGVHSMFTLGLFYSGGSTILFGLLQYLPISTEGTGKDYVYLILAFLIRGSQAVGSSAFVTASMTLVSITFTENTTTVLSYVETIIGLGVMGGPALGSGLYALGGFMLVFVAVGCTMVLSSIVMYFLLPYDVGVTSMDGSSASVREILKDIKIVASLILGSYSGIIWASVDPILEPELRNKFGLNQNLSALCFLLLSVAYAVTAPIVGRCLDNFSCLDSLWMMVFGFSLSGVNFLFAGPSPLLPFLERPLWLLLLCLGIMGISLGFILVPSLDLVFHNDDSADDEDQDINPAELSLISGLWTSAYSFGDFAGPTFSGMMTEYTSFGWTLTCYSVGCFVMIILILLLKLYGKCKKRRQSYTKSKQIQRNISHNNIVQDEKTPLLSSGCSISAEESISTKYCTLSNTSINSSNDYLQV